MNMNGNDHLPSYFNAADKWPGKIHEPLDQGNCNASWAFSTAGESEKTQHRPQQKNTAEYSTLCMLYNADPLSCRSNVNPVTHF